MVKSSEDKRTGNNDHQLKGIRKRKWGKWVSEIRLPNSRERIWLGSYDTPEKAARAFDAAAFCLRGHTATFNFPMNLPAIENASSLSPFEIQALAAKYANEGTAAAVNPPKQEQSISESTSMSSPPSLVSDDLSPLFNSELDWSFLELLTADYGENSSDFGNPSSYFDQFVADFPAVDLIEELVIPEESSSLWSF